MKRKLVLPTKLLVLLFLFIFASCQSTIKVACIGDSITNGGGKDAASFYPMQLNNLLGKKYEVLNCGESGATMQTDGNKPYWNEKDLANVFVYKPTVIVIMLGTNDSKTPIWKAASYERDYQLMIDSLRTLPTKPTIYLCSPPPAYSDKWDVSESTIKSEIIPIINRVATKNNLKVIDIYGGMSNMPNLFYDGIHPDTNGIKLMAKIIAQGIQN